MKMREISRAQYKKAAVNNKWPFTSINYGTCTEQEGRLVIRTLLLGSIKGIGFHHNTPIFPCGIFQYMKGVNDKPGTPNYDLKQLAMRSTAQRLYPNYCNCDVTMQSDWVAYDRAMKKEVLESLSKDDTKMLLKRLEENPSLQSSLTLRVTVDKKVTTDEVQQPIELMSTMGKRKL